MIHIYIYLYKTPNSINNSIIIYNQIKNKIEMSMLLFI